MSSPPLVDRLRARNWRLTAQRRVIAEVMEGEHVHLSAEEVLQRARQRLREVSLATVYNTLNELVAMGEVKPVDAGSGATRYDPNTGASHHHLVCLGCNQLLDVYLDPSATAIELPPSERHGFRILGEEILFRGWCPSCSDQV